VAPEAEILLADDDDVGRYVVATMLRRAGFAVREAMDGVQAVADALRAPPDLAVLDVKMPGYDGFEACRLLKADPATRHVPVLLLSATFLDSDHQVEGLETGADSYLTQPVEAPVLAATVRSLRFSLRNIVALLSLDGILPGKLLLDATTLALSTDDHAICRKPSGEHDGTADLLKILEAVLDSGRILPLAQRAPVERAGQAGDARGQFINADQHQQMQGQRD